MPARGAVHEYQTVAASPGNGSPVSRVAPTSDPCTDPSAPLIGCAAANASLPGDAEIVHDRCIGGSSVFPAVSVARTRNACVPSARPVYATGDVHAANAAASSAHWNVAPGSLANVNVASVE